MPNKKFFIGLKLVKFGLNSSVITIMFNVCDCMFTFMFVVIFIVMLVVIRRFHNYIFVTRLSFMINSLLSRGVHVNDVIRLR